MIATSSPSQTQTPEQMARELARRINDPVGLLSEQETRLAEEHLLRGDVECLLRLAQQQPGNSYALLSNALRALAHADRLNLEARAIGLEARSLCRRYVRIEASKGRFATPLLHRLREWS